MKYLLLLLIIFQTFHLITSLSLTSSSSSSSSSSASLSITPPTLTITLPLIKSNSTIAIKTKYNPLFNLPNFFPYSTILTKSTVKQTCNVSTSFALNHIPTYANFITPKNKVRVKPFNDYVPLSSTIRISNEKKKSWWSYRHFTLLPLDFDKVSGNFGEGWCPFHVFEFCKVVRFNNEIPKSKSKANSRISRIPQLKITKLTINPKLTWLPTLRVLDFHECFDVFRLFDFNYYSPESDNKDKEREDIVKLENLDLKSDSLKPVFRNLSEDDDDGDDYYDVFDDTIQYTFRNLYVYNPTTKAKKVEEPTKRGLTFNKPNQHMMYYNFRKVPSLNFKIFCNEPPIQPSPSTSKEREKVKEDKTGTTVFSGYLTLNSPYLTMRHNVDNFSVVENGIDVYSGDMWWRFDHVFALDRGRRRRRERDVDGNVGERSRDWWNGGIVKCMYLPKKLIHVRYNSNDNDGETSKKSEESEGGSRGSRSGESKVVLDGRIDLVGGKNYVGVRRKLVW